MDQIDRLLLKTEGELEVQKLTIALEAEEAALRAAIQAHGAHSVAAFSAAQNVVRVSTDLRAAQISTLQATAATGGLTQSFTQLAYAANDADQFNVSFGAGVRALSNQLPGLAAAAGNLAQVGFGGITAALLSPAGLVVGLTAVASLAPVIVNHWGDIEDLMGQGHVEDEAEEFDRLSKAISKTADEQARFNQIRREQETHKALTEGEPKETTAARRAATEAVNELPGGTAGLAAALAAARNPGGFTANTAPLEVQRQIAEQQRFVKEQKESYATSLFGLGVTGETHLKELEGQGIAAGKEAELKKAQEDIENAVADPKKFGPLIDSLRKRGDAALTALADKLAAATPEGRRDAELNKQGADIEEQSLKELATAEKERAQLIDELNKAGLENESEGVAAQNKADDEYEKQQRKLAELQEGADEARRDAEMRDAKEGGADIIAGAAAKGGGNAEQISQLLQGRGIDAETADALAQDAAGQQRRSQLQEFFNQKPKQAEVFGSQEAYLERAQASVGGARDTPEQQLQVQKDMAAKLGQLLEQTRGFGFGNDSEARF